MSEYESVADAMKAIDVAVEQTLADSPELAASEDSVYHDVAQAIMTVCDPETAREVSRRTGVSQ